MQSRTFDKSEIKTGKCTSVLRDSSIETLQSFLARLLDREKLKSCEECGVCTGACPVASMVPDKYNPRLLLENSALSLAETLQERGLWLCARCYTCYDRCPQMIDLPEIFSQIRRFSAESGYLSDSTSGLDEALKVIQEEIPLPAIYAWLCLYPDKLNSQSREIDKVIIEKLKSFVADRMAKKVTPATCVRSERIAIIGSGPAGLTAACELATKGYSVTVFESLPVLGGMLGVGIPDYRLSKEALEAELAYISSLGVKIRTDVTVGRDVKVDELLKEGYAAIFVATGAHESVNLDIEGKQLTGVFQALDLLKKLSMGERVELGEKVAVIGGGNVAIDVARTALRLNAKDVNILYRRSRAEMPANPSEVRDAEMDGAKIHFLVQPTKIVGNGKRVVGVECIRVQLGELDETGRRQLIPVESSDYTIDVDTIILAIGCTSDLSFLPKDVAITGRNTIAVDPVTLETSSPGIFAGGDVVSGPASVVNALVAGKRAACSIDRRLRGEIETW